jgi:hypothetical protein
MSQVSFRFLQAVTNPITDDRVTVGLLHWDGFHLRFAHRNKVSCNQTVLFALKAIQKQVDSHTPNPSETNLKKVFEVAEGDVPLLKWSDVSYGLTSNSDQHFIDLIAIAGIKNDHPDIEFDDSELYWQCGCEQTCLKK